MDKIHTSSSFCSSLVVLLDSKNLALVIEMSLLTCMQVEMYVIPYLLPVMAAMFDFQHTETSVRVLTSHFVLPDPKNMDIAVGI